MHISNMDVASYLRFYLDGIYILMLIEFSEDNKSFQTHNIYPMVFFRYAATDWDRQGNLL